jgi:TPP-dependent pyruvate/acetoin dehydrogenase alpha subunit
MASYKKSFSLISDETFRRMYAAMLGCRMMEERTRRELRSRRTRKQLAAAPPPSTPLLGEEALVVGTTIDLLPEDTIAAPSGEVVLRSPSQPARKKPRGKAAQAEQALAESRKNVIAFAASTGAQLTIGTGVALAYKDTATDKKPPVVVAFGNADGESEGSWHEALHLAGRHQLPILFVLRPGGLKQEPKQASAVLASILERAKLAGVTTIPVDYTDVVAMYRVSFESIARARKRTGATLIVSTQFTIEGEGRSASKQNPDPIKRMEEYLANKGLFSAKWKAEVMRQFK